MEKILLGTIDSFMTILKKSIPFRNFLPLRRIISILFLSILMPCKVYALDITAGAATWLAWSEQHSKRAETKYTLDMESDVAFLYGPTLSVKFNEDFNLTFVFLYGRFTYKNQDPNDSTNFKSDRIDIDTALNYRLNEYFKVFGGIKYLSFDMMQVPYYSDLALPQFYEQQGLHRSLGLGLGLSATIPVSEDIFLLGTLSGFYLANIGKEKIAEIDLVIGTIGSSKAKYRDYGINSQFSAAYYIASMSTAINLGVRMQYFITDYNNDEYPVTIKHIIYGITLSATYSFNI